MALINPVALIMRRQPEDQGLLPDGRIAGLQRSLHQWGDRRIRPGRADATTWATKMSVRKCATIHVGRSHELNIARR